MAFQRVRFGGRTVPAVALGRARSSRGRGRSCAGSRRSRPSPPCYPPTRARARRARARRGVGRRGLAAARAPAAVAALRGRRRTRDGELPGRREAAGPAPALRVRRRPPSPASSAALNDAQRGRGARRPARPAAALDRIDALDRRRRARRRRSPTRPTCRSAPRVRAAADDRRRRGPDRTRPAERQARALWPDWAGSVPAGAYPQRWRDDAAAAVSPPR